MREYNTAKDARFRAYYIRRNRCHKNKAVSYFMQDESRAASSPFSRVSSVMRLNRCARGTLLSRARISFWHRGIDSYRSLAASSPSVRLRQKGDRGEPVRHSLRRTMEFVWAWLTSGLHNRAKCRNALKRRRYSPLSPPPGTGRLGETLAGALEVCNFLRKRCSAVIHHCYGEYWDIYRRRGPSGWKQME